MDQIRLLAKHSLTLKNVLLAILQVILAIIGEMFQYCGNHSIYSLQVSVERLMVRPLNDAITSYMSRGSSRT